jgi:hypothetical protein
VELLPRPFNIRALQMDLIRKYQLEAERIGSDSDIHLRILPFHTRIGEDGETSETDSADGGFDDFVSANGDTNGSVCSVDRLPLLPD